MALTRTWIDSHLSPAERTALVDWLCERAANPTGELIRQGLAELRPSLGDDELPSVQSCLTWRNKCWQWEMHRRELRADADAAKVLSQTDDSSLNEANRRLTDAYVFQQLRALREGGEVDAEQLHNWMLASARLAKVSQSAKKLESELALAQARLQEHEAKRKEAEAILARATAEAKSGGLTAETLQEMERRAKIL